MDEMNLTAWVGESKRTSALVLAVTLLLVSSASVQSAIASENAEVPEQVEAPLAPAAAPIEERGSPAISVTSLERGRLEVQSADGDFSLRLAGRIHFDGNWYTDTDTVDFGSGTQLRRMWFELEARLWRDWGWKFAYNIADSGRSGFQDLYIQYTPLDNTTLRLGHIREHLGMEMQTATNCLTFLEYALPSALLPPRSIGLAVYQRFDWLTAAFGVYGEGLEKVSDTAEGTEGLDDGWAVGARLTLAPLRSATSLLHLGASAVYRMANDVGGTLVGTPLRIRQRPEASISSWRLVDTGDAIGPLSDVVTWALEAAGVLGPLSLQAEYINLNLFREGSGLSRIGFAGFYVQGSWILTGESRPYNPATGRFSNPRVNGALGRGGAGALELAARFSQIDLNHRPGAPEALIGGRESNLTVGFNWYPNDNLRFMLNWVNVLELHRPGHELHGVEPHIFLARAQVYW